MSVRPQLTVPSRLLLSAAERQHVYHVRLTLTGHVIINNCLRWAVLDFRTVSVKARTRDGIAIGGSQCQENGKDAVCGGRGRLHNTYIPITSAARTGF